MAKKTFRQMGLPFLHLRGTTSKVNAYDGPYGELVVDTETDDLVLQNTKAGGVRLAKKSDIAASGFSTGDSTIYVDVANGNNENDGTESHPVKTLARAMNMSDAYAGTHAIYIKGSTSSGNPANYGAFSARNGDYNCYFTGYVSFSSINVRNCLVTFNLSPNTTAKSTITVAEGDITIHRAGSLTLHTGLTLSAPLSSFEVYNTGVFSNHGTLTCNQLLIGRCGIFLEEATTASEEPVTTVAAVTGTDASKNKENAGVVFVSQDSVLRVLGKSFTADALYIRRSSSALLSPAQLTVGTISASDGSSCQIGGDNPSAQRSCTCTANYLHAVRSGSIYVTAQKASGTLAAAPTTLNITRATNGNCLESGGCGYIRIDGQGGLVTVNLASTSGEVDSAIYSTTQGCVYIHDGCILRITGKFQMAGVVCIQSSWIAIMEACKVGSVQQGTSSSGAAAGGRAYYIDYNSGIRFSSTNRNLSDSDVGSLPGATGIDPLVGSHGSNFYSA